MLSLSLSWCPSSSFLNCYSAGAGDSGWCLHTLTYHNAVVTMLIIEDFLLHPGKGVRRSCWHRLYTWWSCECSHGQPGRSRWWNSWVRSNMKVFGLWILCLCEVVKRKGGICDYCMCPLLYKPCCLSCWRPYDHLGHRCWSKLVPNLLLKLGQSLTNFYPNLATFSKNNKLVIPTLLALFLEILPCGMRESKFEEIVTSGDLLFHVPYLLRRN